LLPDGVCRVDSGDSNISDEGQAIAAIGRPGQIFRPTSAIAADDWLGPANGRNEASMTLVSTDCAALSWAPEFAAYVLRWQLV
jgi:hypothetical protein